MWNCHSNTSPFTNSGDVIIITVRYLFELCVAVEAIEEWTPKSVVIHTIFRLYVHWPIFTSTAITLYKINGHVVLFETYLIRWKSLYWSLKPWKYLVCVPLQKVNIISSSLNKLGCHPLKLFQFQRYVPNSTLNCLLIRNYAIKHCLAYYALFAHVKLYAKQFFPSITSSSDIPTM